VPLGYEKLERLGEVRISQAIPTIRHSSSGKKCVVDDTIASEFLFASPPFLGNHWRDDVAIPGRFDRRREDALGSETPKPFE
jgi:hypothetical protein